MRCPISSRNPIRNAISAILAAIGLKSRAPRNNPNDVVGESIECTTPDGSIEKISFLKAGTSNHVRIILIHGSPGSAKVWSRYLNNPQPDIEYISVDRAGYGSSGEGDRQSSLANQTALLKPLLADGKINVVVGHSYGGAVAAHLAATYPEKVHGLILVSSALDPTLEKVLLIQRLMEAPPFKWLIPKNLRVSNQELIELKAELDKLSTALPKIKSNVHVIHGTRDALVPISNVDYMAERFSACKKIEITRLAGRNHFIPWNSYECVNKAIKDMALQLNDVV